MYVIKGALLTYMLLFHGTKAQVRPVPTQLPGFPTDSTASSFISSLSPMVPPVTPGGASSAGSGGSSGDGAINIVPSTGLATVTASGNLFPPSITISGSPFNMSSPNPGPSVTGTVGFGGPGNGISIILSTQDCVQRAVQCPQGYMMSFCTGCLAKCTKSIESFSFAAFKEHMKIVTAPDGTNCTTNFFSVIRQGTCRLGSCVTPIFPRNSKFKLCPFDESLDKHSN
ncbi:uncharacterized protein LOC111242919 [Varroa destructor]|uniref:Uncharacterized protein n=1 Tax=Varroa destructor TaxID=109461 RepID=A0A7M7IWV9_VARDE|nr:uncharacterized protein LOC111242919 [Varroa destructor]XP_022643602.1 uncharacterized protein LOC111242919 [Varroa destructor]